MLVFFLVGCGTSQATPTPLPEPTQAPPELIEAPPEPTEAQPEPTAPQVEPSPTEPPKRRWTDVPYIQDGLAFHELDVYLPSNGDGPFPTILTIHGGGFQAGSKSLYYLLAKHFNELDYALVSTNYRFAQRYPYPAPVDDVFCALAWVHANNETYNIDNERIIVMGDSAGGYLAAMLGTVETPSAYLENCPYSLPETDWIQGAVIFYGFYDFTSLDGYQEMGVNAYLEPFWGAKYSEIPPETLAEMSPISWVDGSEPSFLILHGTSDTRIPSKMSEDFAAVLEGAGVDVELVLLDAKHAFIAQSLSSPENVQSLEAIETFLSELLMQ
jgi:acetyl esterase/lipase